MSFTTCRLGDALTLKRGYDLPARRRLPGEVPVVSSSGITGYHSRAKRSAPGVVTGRYGTLGNVYYMDSDYWPLNTALYVVDFKGTRPRFAAYFLKHVLRDFSSDKAAVPGVHRDMLHHMQVSVPDASTQEAVASILSAYDNLIENNRRRIQLLEETAQLLYKEWFVHHRFPGREHITVTYGLPEEWARKPLSALCRDVRESVDPRTLPPGTIHIGLKHIPRRSITLSEWESSSGLNSTKFVFLKDDILFGKIRPYFHKVGFALVNGITSSDTIVIRPVKDNSYEYVLLLLSSDDFISFASQTVREGSKMPRADWKFLLTSFFLVPPPQLLQLFREATRPLLEQLRNLALANRRLGAARDLLLPRLMNGEIPV